MSMHILRFVNRFANFVCFYTRDKTGSNATMNVYAIESLGYDWINCSQTWKIYTQHWAMQNGLRSEEKLSEWQIYIYILLYMNICMVGTHNGYGRKFVQRRKEGEWSTYTMLDDWLLLWGEVFRNFVEINGILVAFWRPRLENINLKAMSRWS